MEGGMWGDKVLNNEFRCVKQEKEVENEKEIRFYGMLTFFGICGIGYSVWACSS
jgi:hypothetical protein